jgi:6-phosphogluconolactonase
MPRREFLTGLAALAAGTRPLSRRFGSQSGTLAQPPRFMYVGSFTKKDGGHGEGLSVFHRRNPTSAWSRVQLLEKIDDPSFLNIDRHGRFLYSSHGDGTVATAYRIDETTGQLTIINQQPTGGVNGAHLDIDGTGRFLAVANYASGTVALLTIHGDGSLGSLSDLATLTGEPGPHRTQQTSSHPHHCPFDPSGRFIVVPDKGLDRVFVFSLDSARGKLMPADPPSVASRSGAAPRHVAFHPGRPWAFVVNEIDSTIAAYRFDPDTHVVQPFQIIPSVPPSFTGNNSGAEIWVAPSGRFVYASNRGHDSIAIFAVDQGSGELSPVAWEPTQGRTPRFFALDPSATELYAANQGSDTIVAFTVDTRSGSLAPTGEVLKAASATTIVFR